MKNFAEFFAGVGLVREGLQQDGWNCIFANDLSEDKQATYIDNFGSEDFYLGNIWELTHGDEVPDEAFLYTASFPCTDLSVAGNRAGLAGVHSGSLNAVFEILNNKESRGVKPPLVMLENVKGFLTSHNGQDIRNTVQLFTELNYYVDIIELDAVYFTPQSRQRIFIIALDKELAVDLMKIKSPENLLDSWWYYFDRNPQLRSNKLRQVILSAPELNWGLFDFEFNNAINDKLFEVIENDIPVDSDLWWDEIRTKKLFDQMNNNHKAKLLLNIQCEEVTYGTVYRRMRKGKSTAEYRTDGVAGCLRTPKGGSSKQILIVAGQGDWRVRLLTPREYARLQGVRDDFRLPQNANKGYFAMGDAVCVPAIEFLSKNILSPVFKYFKSLGAN